MTIPAVTVVIATIATRGKTPALLRAIASIRDQDMACRIIAVVNGNKRDDELVKALRHADDIDVQVFEEGNLVKALTFGVGAVRTPYFCVLDDDDVLMPGACRKRFEYMEANPSADVLVTAGIKQHADGRIERVPARLDRNDPLTSLFDCNWLPSCGAIYRRARIGPGYFSSMPRYLEWTHLAFRLVRERCVHFSSDDNEPHFKIFETVGSESLSLNYVVALPGNIARLRDEALPEHIQHLLGDKLARAFHDAASRCMTAGRTREAWVFHLASLRQRRGARYLPFTRHLIVAALQAVLPGNPKALDT